MHRQSGAKRVTIRCGKPFDTVHFIAKTGQRGNDGRASIFDPAHPLAVQEIKLLNKEGGLARPLSFGARDAGLVDNLDKADWKKPDYRAMACSLDTNVISPTFGPWKKPANVKLLWCEDTNAATPVLDDDNLISHGSYGTGSKRLLHPGTELDDLSSHGLGRVAKAPDERLARHVSFEARDSDFAENLDESYWKKPNYGTMECSQDTGVISPRFGPWKKPAIIKVTWREDGSGATPIIENEGYDNSMYAIYEDVEKQSGITIGSKSGGSSGYDGDVSESITEKKTGWKKCGVRIAKVFFGIVGIAIIFAVAFIVIEVLRSRGLAFKYFWDPFEQARKNPDSLFLLDQAPNSG